MGPFEKCVDPDRRVVEVFPIDCLKYLASLGGKARQDSAVFLGDARNVAIPNKQRTQCQLPVPAHRRLPIPASSLPAGQQIHELGRSLEQVCHVTVKTHLTSLRGPSYLDRVTDNKALGSPELSLGSQLPTAVRVLIVGRFVNRLGAFSMPFLAVLLVQDYGANARVAGLVVSAFGLATIPSRLLGGQLATRLGTKTAVMIGLGGTAAAQALIAVSPSLTVTLAGSVLLGLCFEIYEPASQGLVADVTPEHSRPRAYGLLEATLALAGLLAGLIAAVVGRVDLSGLFAADAITAVACLMLVAVCLPASRPSGTRDDPAEPAPSPWTDSRLLLLMTTGTVFATVYMLIPMVMPLALLAGHRPASDAGLLQALAALIIVLAQPAMRSRGNVTSRLAAGYGLLAAGLTIAGLNPTMAGYVTATIVIAFGDVLLLGNTYTLVAAIAPVGSRAKYFACYGITWGIALTVGPLLMGQLLTDGYRSLWLACATLMVATGIAQLVISRVVRAPCWPPQKSWAQRVNAKERSTVSDVPRGPAIVGVGSPGLRGNGRDGRPFG